MFDPATIFAAFITSLCCALGVVFVVVLVVWLGKRRRAQADAAGAEAAGAAAADLLTDEVPRPPPRDPPRG